MARFSSRFSSSRFGGGRFATSRFAPGWVGGEDPEPATVPAQMSAPTLTGGVLSATLTLASAPADGGDPITIYGYEVTTAADTDWSDPVATGTQTPANLGNAINLSPLAVGDYMARSWAINSVGAGIPSANSATATVEDTPATVPAQIGDGDWSLVDSPSAGGDKLALGIDPLPDDGGSALTALQYSVGGGAAQTLSGLGTGTRQITVIAETLASAEVRAVNAVGAGPWSNPKTATPSVIVIPDDEITFGELTQVGAGGVPTAESDGTYGQFTVASGMITPNVSPLTVGSVSVGGTTVNVLANTYSCRTEAEVIALDPWTISTVGRPNVTVDLRAGCVLTASATVLFGGSFPRPNPVTIYGKVTVRGPVDSEGNRLAGFTRWMPARVTSANPEAGFRLENLRSNFNLDNAAATAVTAAYQNETVLEVAGVHHFGIEYELFGDYGAKIDYENLVGEFVVGDDLDSEDYSTTAQRRRIMEVRPATSTTGTLIVDDSTQYSQTPNTLILIQQDSTLSGVTSGATATCATPGYSTRPENGTFVYAAAADSPRAVRVTNCVVTDTGSSGIAVGAGEEVFIEGNSVERYYGDAFKVLPNGLGVSQPALTFRANRMSRPVALGTDLGNPHCDALQIQGAANFEPFNNAEISFNEFFDGGTRGISQGFLIKTYAGHFWNDSYVVGNALAMLGARAGLSWGNSVGGIYRNNGIIELRDADGDRSIYALGPESVVDDSETFEGNLYSFATIDLSNGAYEAFNTIENLAGVSTGQVAFAGLPTGEPRNITSFEEMAIAMAPGPDANPNAGPYGAAVDREAMTLDASYLEANPVLTSPTAVAITDTTATIGFTTDTGNGSVWYVARAPGTAPIGAQIKAGNDAGDAAAAVAGEVVLSGTGVHTLDIAGLTGSTDYIVDFYQEDGLGRPSAVITASEFTTPAPAAWVPRLVDSNGTGYHTAVSGAIAHSSKMTLFARLKPQAVTTSARIFDAASRVEVTIIAGKFSLTIRDSVNTIVYQAQTTNVVVSVGVDVRMYLAVDLTVPSVVFTVDGVAVPMTVTTSIIAGNGLIGLARALGVLAASNGAAPLDTQVSDLYVTSGEIISEASLTDSGAVKDLTGIGTPKIWLGGNMTANERAGNTAQGWNDSYNRGSITLTTASSTFTDVP